MPASLRAKGKLLITVGLDPERTPHDHEEIKNMYLTSFTHLRGRQATSTGLRWRPAPPRNVLRRLLRPPVRRRRRRGEERW